MDYQKSIHFLKEAQKSDGYSITTVYRHQKWSRFWIELMTDSFILSGPNFMKQYMTTQLPRRLFRRSKHVMVIDCDSYSDMKSATEHLFLDQISHCVIESSPGRYWIITDKVGLIKELYPMMLISGVDREYVRFIYFRKKFHLRAYPKNGFIPRVVGTWMSSDVGRIRSHTGTCLEHYRLYREWLSAFLDYWNSPGMVLVAGNLRDDASANGVLLEQEVGELYMVPLGRYATWERVNYTEIVVPEPETETEEPRIEINNCLDYMEI